MPGVDYESMLSELGKFGASLHPGDPEPRQAGRPLPHHAGHPPGQRGLPGRLPGGGQRRPPAGVGAGQGPGDRGRHRVPARPPLLRPGHRGDGADGRLLHDGQRKPEEGDPERADRIRAAGRAYTTDGPGHRRTPTPRARKVEEYRRAGEAQKGREQDEESGGQSPETGGAISAKRDQRARRPGDGRRGAGNEARGTASCSASWPRCPSSTGWSWRRRLRLVPGRGLRGRPQAGGRGLVASSPTPRTSLPPTRRFHLTAAGLRRLAETRASPDGCSAAAPSRPVAAHPDGAAGRRGRRLPAGLRRRQRPPTPSASAGTGPCRWTPPSTLPGGRTVGVVRQGHTADRTGFAKRLWRLRRGAAARRSSWSSPTRCGCATPAGCC